MLQSDKITDLDCRLSQEDLQAGESGSIQHQRMILKKYAQEHHFTNIKFFIDDGGSGVSFEREGLQAMLREVEAGHVATVITKDLSRLGRNYLKTGELIEIIFPEYEVRYIAINDGVDTASGDNEFTPLRNWFNEFYARYTSKKIRAVKQTQAQKWLADNRIMTVGALRFERTGQTRYHNASLIPYSWPDKTLYGILARQEYLGHTITGKSYKVSYKCKKTKKNPDDKRYFFPNTHEALIDEETFELAQKRLATRHRPTKAEEIDIFSGLLFCGDCGYKMYLQQGVSIPERKHAYTCGNYRNRPRKRTQCTTHYIRKSVITELVLADLQRVLSYVGEHEKEFIQTAAEYGNRELKKALQEEQKELDNVQMRIREIDTVFRKLYEDNALGRLSNEQFNFMTSGYEEEKKTLSERIRLLETQIHSKTERNSDVKKFVQLVKNHTQVGELTYENVHEFIDRILIYELDKETNTHKIEILYNFVGKVSNSQEPIKNTSYFRQIGADVDSIVI